MVTSFVTKVARILSLTVEHCINNDSRGQQQQPYRTKVQRVNNGTSKGYLCQTRKILRTQPDVSFNCVTPSYTIPSTSLNTLSLSPLSIFAIFPRN